MSINNVVTEHPCVLLKTKKELQERHFLTPYTDPLFYPTTRIASSLTPLRVGTRQRYARLDRQSRESIANIIRRYALNMESGKFEPSKKGIATGNVTVASVGGKSFFQEQSYLRMRHWFLFTQ